MIDTYKTYLAADRSLTLEEMEQLHGDDNIRDGQ